MKTYQKALNPCISSVQSLSHVWLFAAPWTAAHQTSLSINNSQSLLKLMSMESVMPVYILLISRRPIDKILDFKYFTWYIPRIRTAYKKLVFKLCNLTSLRMSKFFHVGEKEQLCFTLSRKCICLHVKLLQACPTLYDCSLPDYPVRGILQARILEWVAMPSAGDLDGTCMHYISCIGRWVLYH